MLQIVSSLSISYILFVSIFVSLYFCVIFVRHRNILLALIPSPSTTPHAPLMQFPSLYLCQIL